MVLKDSVASNTAKYLRVFYFTKIILYFIVHIIRVVQIIRNHGKLAKRLCDKDPLIMLSMKYLHEMFPRAKFILMLRDGRAAVHSIINRRIPVIGFSLNEPEV